MFDFVKRDELIDKLVSNLPILRAKLKMSQAELAELVGISRQTLVAIENGNSKMHWDTFLAMILVMSEDDETSDLMLMFGLNVEDIQNTIAGYLSNRKNPTSFQEKLWTDCNFSDISFKGIVPLPIGLKDVKCPKCHSVNTKGILMSETSDEQDPNIVCLDCGYWWD